MRASEDLQVRSNPQKRWNFDVAYTGSELENHLMMVKLGRQFHSRKDWSEGFALIYYVKASENFQHPPPSFINLHSSHDGQVRVKGTY